ncbi:AlpA family phage regulatory protein [Burkholderia cenocepacia]|nr:AlpA family phage regulatory protein [Burkholderia cenocepacia]
MAESQNVRALSRESIRLREIAGRFPRRVQLGSQRCIAWSNREIHRWLSDPANYRTLSDAASSNGAEGKSQSKRGGRQTFGPSFI